MWTPSLDTSPAATYSMTCVTQPHSGWIRKSASGCSARISLMSAGRMPACTWHSPSQTCSLTPSSFSTYEPSHMSGPNRTGVSGPCVSRTCLTTWTAFALVQQ